MSTWEEKLRHTKALLDSFHFNDFSVGFHLQGRYLKPQSLESFEISRKTLASWSKVRILSSWQFQWFPQQSVNNYRLMVLTVT